MKFSFRLSFFLLLTFLIFSIDTALSQAPDFINYQAAVRDNAGNVLANQSVDFRLTIRESGPSGPIVLEETHTETTSALGLVNLQIGAGTVSQGSMSSIDWPSANHYLTVEINTGSGFVNLGTTQFVSVPYAFASKKATSMETNDLNDVQSSTVATGQVLKFDGSNWIPSGDSDGQTLSVSGSSLSISNGNSVNLPSPTLTPGAGIGISGSTITNTAPDQVITLTGSGATSVTGTYPNFTVSSTNAGLTAGNGISISGTTITNSAPDQQVNLTGTGDVTITGSYPNYTINSNPYTAGSGIAIINNQIVAANLLAMWNASSLNSGPLPLTAPNDGDILVWDQSLLSWQHEPKSGLWTETNSNLGQIAYNLGNVGIGTSAAFSPLHISGAMAEMRIEGIGSTGSGGAVVFGDSTNMGPTIQHTDTSTLSISANKSFLNTTSFKIFNPFTANTDVEYKTYPMSSSEFILYGINGTRNAELTYVASSPNNGAIVVYDSLGGSKAAMRTNEQGGSIYTVGPNGLFNTYLGSNSADNDFGELFVLNDQGATSISLQSATNNTGRILAYGPNSVNAILGSEGSADHGSFSLWNASGGSRVSFSIGLNGSGMGSFVGQNGNSNVFISSYSGYPNHGQIVLSDSLGGTSMELYSNQNNVGILQTYGPSGTRNIRLTALSANADLGSLNISDDSGVNKLQAYVDPNGTNREGVLWINGTNGLANVVISALSGNTNHGYLSVSNSGGVTKAGVYVDQFGNGVVFGDQKNFRMNHPTEEGKEIWYGSLEGPELAAYTRGTAVLKNGEAAIQFPEHFLIVSNTETMTITLTPLDASSEGLAVVEKTVAGFIVKELRNGTGNYSFDWEVKCVRNGYEDFRVIRDASEMRSSASLGNNETVGDE